MLQYRRNVSIDNRIVIMSSTSEMIVASAIPYNDRKVKLMNISKSNAISVNLLDTILFIYFLSICNIPYNPFIQTMKSVLFNVTKTFFNLKVAYCVSMTSLPDQLISTILLFLISFILIFLYSRS